jgi:4-hydroxyphenylpyruvate dioxygenase
MRKSIATVSLSGTLAEKLTAIADAGFDGVEIFENDLLASPLSPEEVRVRAADLGLGIDLYQPFRDFEAVPADVLDRNLRRAEHKFDVMERLGSTRLLVCSNVSPEAVDDDALAAEQLRLLAERAAGHGIRIAYEALAWGRHVNEYLHAWRIARMADHPSLGVCLDSFHILSRGSDPGGIEAIPGEKIFFLQLADAPLLAMDVLQWSRHYRCFPGQGGFDLAGLVAHVLRAGYSGPLSLEVFNDVFRQADTARTAVDAMRSLIALEESVARRLPQAAALSVPPRPVVPTGFAFAELAVAGGDELGALLRALGLARTGVHGGKPVELWEQGQARILLNAGGPA